MRAAEWRLLTLFIRYKFSIFSGYAPLTARRVVVPLRLILNILSALLNRQRAYLPPIFR